MKLELKLDNITVDKKLHQRASFHESVVDEYAEALANGAKFPPVSVVTDWEDYWLYDGFYRLAAAKKAGHDTIIVNASVGTHRDAELLAYGANAENGLRMSNADRLRNVTLLIEYPAFSQWSDLVVARHCGVSPAFVGKVRAELGAKNLGGAQ